MRAIVIVLLAGSFATQAAAQRRITVEDQFRIVDVGNPQLSPDGEWVVYTATATDPGADRRNTDIWMIRSDGSSGTRLTFSPADETGPQWSPDGRFISFLSSRPGPAEGNQVWVLDRSGGEARQLTKFRGGVSSYRWSPDSTRLAIVAREPVEVDDDEATRTGDRPREARKDRPIVVDRYEFKRDGPTYLAGSARNRIFIYDIAAGTAQRLTADGDYDESGPEWSPDGRRIAFSSNHDADHNRTRNTDVFVVDATPGSKSRKLTTFPGRDGGSLAWSPDGTLIAYARGSEPKFDFHNLYRLAVVPADGGEPRVLTETLDRGTSSYTFTEDGRAILFTVADDRTQYLAQVPVAGGPVQRIVSGQRVVAQPTRVKGRTVVVASTSTEPREVFAVDGSELRKLTSHNDALLADLQLAPAEDIAFTSKDETTIHGLLTRPIGYVAGRRYPTIVWLHGGPTSQDAHTFSFERQLFAAHGYAVVNVNYRGSSGRGAGFSEAIVANWGVLEVDDVLAATDYLVAQGIADPERLGVGGWSYGGVLTDYVIASDTRFKAAISGAGSANHISLYKNDRSTFLYDNEFGPPWENIDLWIKFSYPFFKANRIKTPTLFIGGQDDFNVPILGSEQMYQALRTLNVPTQLVVYPGEKHRLTKVAFLRDRSERYLAWFGRFLQDQKPTTEGTRSSR